MNYLELKTLIIKNPWNFEDDDIVLANITRKMAHIFKEKNEHVQNPQDNEADNLDTRFPRRSARGSYSVQ
jgi:hypothetical protein